MNSQLFRWSSVALILLCSSACNAKDAKQAAKSKTPASRITSKVDVGPVAKLSADESREVSFAAGRIMKHVAQARQDIAVKKHEDALKHINQSLKLVKIIENVLPQYTVKTKIKSGDLVYTDEDEITPTYITLYDELVRRDFISPVLKAKTESKKKSASKKGASKKKGDSTTPLAVKEADVDYTSVKLDFN